jgi:hypothetical protein
MGPDGRWQLGTAPKSAAKDPLQRFRANETYWNIQAFLNRFPLLRHRAAQAAVVIAILIPIVIWSAQLYYRSTADIPETLIGRAGLVAHSLADDDRWSLQLVVDDETEDDALRWHDMISDQLKLQPGEPAHLVAVHVAFENRVENSGCVVIDYRKGATTVTAAEIAEPEFSGDDEDRESFRGFLRLVTFWKFSPEVGWRLDGRRTLRDYKTTSS